MTNPIGLIDDAVRRYATQMTTIIFIPCCTIVFRSIFCAFDSACNSSIAELLLALLAAVAFLALAILYSAFSFDNDGEQSKRFALSRSATRVEMLCLAVQAFISASFQIPLLRDSHLILGIIYTVSTTVMAGLYTWYLPYLNRRIMTLRVIIAWMHAWSGVSLMLCVLMNDTTDQTAPILLFLSAPLVGVLAVVAMSARRIHVSQKPVNAISDPHEVCLELAQLICKYDT